MNAFDIAKKIHGLLEVGDFINLDDWYEDIWAEVISISDLNQRYLPSCSYAVHAGARSVYLDRIRYIHKKDDPWDDGEFRNGNCLNSERPRYKGTYSLSPWIWYRNGLHADPKNPIPLEKFLKKAGVVGTNMSFEEAHDAIGKIKDVKFGPWSLLCEAIPDTIYNKRIRV